MNELNDPEEELSINPKLVERIYDQAKRDLTYYMIPNFTVIVRDFAKTPNGKLDKKALPTPRELLQQQKFGEIASQAEEAGQNTSKGQPGKELKDGHPRPASTYICDAVEKLRGVRPAHPKMSLASFGLDSLGSVMLMRQLSTSMKGEALL
jgi:hypothetical protein